MLRRAVVVLVVALPAGGLPAASPPLTVEEALLRAESSSPQARAIALEAARARAGARAAGLWDDPEISFEREEAAGEEEIAALSFRLPLWGRTGLERDAAEAGAGAAEAEAAIGRLRLRGAVRAAHLDLLAAQERLAAADRGCAALRDLVAALGHREREGESSAFDLGRAERALADAEADRLEARGRLGTARPALAALVGLPAGELVAAGPLAAPDGPPPIADLRAPAAARGDVRALEALAGAADLEARALRRAVVPEPSLTLGHKTAIEDDRRASGPVLGVAFALPLFRRGQPARAAGSAADLLRARHEAALRRAEAEIGAAHAAAAAAAEAAAAYAAAADPEGLARMARASYEAGEARILEVIDAYRTVLDVRFRRIDLDAAAARAAIEFDLALGEEVSR